MGDEPGGWVPEFEGQRPPFAPGNTLATRTHGAYSPRAVDPIARDLVDQVLAEPATGYLQAPQWRPALWAWARAEAQVQLLTEYLAKRAEETDDGIGDLDADSVRSAYLLLHRAETRATTQRTRLGLDPLSAARIGRDRASAQLDAATLMARLADEERRRTTEDDPADEVDGAEGTELEEDADDDEA